MSRVRGEEGRGGGVERGEEEGKKWVLGGEETSDENSNQKTDEEAGRRERQNPQN